MEVGTLREFGILNSNWCSIIIIVGVVISSMFVIYSFLSLFGKESRKSAKYFFAIGLIASLITYLGGWSIDRYYDDPRDRAAKVVREQKIEDCMVLGEEKFYLKEITGGDLVYVEPAAVAAGYNLIVGGRVYGIIDSTQSMSLFYLDNDKVIDEITGIYRVGTIPMKNMRFLTIGAGERPYFQCDLKREVLWASGGGEREVITIESFTFYLPQDWKITGANIS